MPRIFQRQNCREITAGCQEVLDTTNCANYTDYGGGGTQGRRLPGSARTRRDAGAARNGVHAEAGSLRPAGGSKAGPPGGRPLPVSAAPACRAASPARAPRQTGAGGRCGHEEPAAVANHSCPFAGRPPAQKKFVSIRVEKNNVSPPFRASPDSRCGGMVATTGAEASSLRRLAPHSPHPLPSPPRRVRTSSRARNRHFPLAFTIISQGFQLSGGWKPPPLWASPLSLPVSCRRLPHRKRWFFHRFLIAHFARDSFSLLQNVLHYKTTVLSPKVYFEPCVFVADRVAVVV